jgi:cysteinyl-tRNA synthetase
MNSSLNDTLTNKFKDLHHTIRWYTCGPTVYDDAHLGHARAYMTMDLMQKIYI